MQLSAARWTLALAVPFIALTAGAARAQGASENDAAKVDMTWGVKIAMRDGVHLNATVYRPHHQRGALPVIFTFTPYIGDSYTDRAVYFASHGFVYALVDVRGRGNSEGEFEPFVNEGHDGYDVTEWLATQPYSNGKVAMWGGSYAGFDQWTVAKEMPPHLATIVPAASVYAGRDFPAENNIFAPYTIQWLTFTSGRTGNDKTFANWEYWSAKEREMYEAHSAFAEYDRLAGNPSPVFQKWIQHPVPDGYYDAMAPTPAEYRALSIPILTITAHYDGDQPGAMTYYRRHMEYGSPEAKAQHYLIIGPWDHAGTRTPELEVGGLTFAPASKLDLNDIHAQWYRWTMEGGPRPDFLKRRVAYYVMGADQWKYADSLGGIANGSLTLYLSSTGGTLDVFHSGMLTAARSSTARADSWTYDPLDNRRGQAAMADTSSAYLTSQSGVLHLFGEGVVYHSDAFADAIEVSGFPKVTLWLSMDVPDTDLGVYLYEILADGQSVQLSEARMRARYRESVRDPKAVPARQPTKYVFDTFRFFSRQVAVGSRLRLVVESLDSPAYEKNYNSGGVVANETGKDARTAHIQLLHDADHVSMLELPIVK